MKYKVFFMLTYRVTKEVSSQSKEAALENEKKSESKTVATSKRVGISGILDKLGKKPKMTVLVRNIFS